MSEKRFTDVWCSETGHIGFTDNGIDKELTSSEFEDFLNELHEEKKELQFQCNLLREQANEFHRGARENANRVGQLERENKELKRENEQLRNDCSILILSNQDYRKENEELKSELQGMEELLKSYRKTIKHDAELLADATKNGYLPPLEELER